ncbi:hypothetical protein TI05_04685 [Achromatium sp. WMS3]|nr:hypothetical protein TI05_04685 [Achromatium sp. WMS3]
MTNNTDVHDVTYITEATNIHDVTQGDKVPAILEPEIPFSVGEKVPAFEDAVYLGILPGGERGGFGTVHKIENRKEHTLYAMKVPKHVNNDVARIRFRHEAERLVSLGTHRNLVRVVHYTDWKQHPCLFMEFIDGPRFEQGFRRTYNATSTMTATNKFTPANRTDAWSQLATPEYLRAFIEVCNGMAYAYAQGILHLDLKPANILWDYNAGVPKIIDFGLTQALFAADTDAQAMPASDAYTQCFTVIGADGGRRGIAGTFPYMAPEQFIGLSACDTRSDIYAFGVVMYEMVTGRLPFTPTTNTEPFTNWRQLHTNKLVEQVPNCDPKLAAIICRCLHKKPLERYPGFAELGEALQTLYLEQVGYYHLMEERTETADSLQERAATLLNLRQLKEAECLARKALQLKPKHIQTHLTLAKCLRDIKPLEAQTLMEQALKYAPENADVISMLGDLHFDAKRWEQAAACMLQSWELNQDLVIHWSNRVHCALKLGRYEEARLILEAAWERFGRDEASLYEVWANYCLAQNRQEDLWQTMVPQLAIDWDGSTHFALANALYQQQMYAEIDKLLAPYLAKHPGINDGLWNLYALALLGLERHEEAIKSLQRARELRPEDTFLAGNLIYALQQAGQATAAIEFADEWLAQDHTPNAHFWNWKGLAHNQLGQYEQYAACHREALKLEPGEAVYAGNLVAALQQANQATAAIEFADAWLAQDHTPHAPFWNQKGIAHNKLGQHEQYAACHREALKLEPGEAVYAGNLVQALQQANQATAALEFADEWLAQGHTPHAHFWNHKGLAHSQLGQHEQDAACHREALKLQPGNATYAGNLVSALWQANQTTTAIEFADAWLAQGHTPNAYFWNWKGLAHNQLGQYEQYAACHREALKLQPGNATYAGNLVDALKKAGQATAAIEFADAWLAQDHTPNAYFGNQKGIAHNRLGQHEQAATCYRKALELEPGNAWFAGNLVYALKQANQATIAIEFADEWLAQGHAPHAPFWNHKGLAHNQLGQYEQYASCCREALKLEPGNADYAGNLIAALRQAGQATAAIEFADEWLAQGYEPNEYFKDQLQQARSQLAIE